MIRAFGFIKKTIDTRRDFLCRIPGLMRLFYCAYRILKPRGVVLARVQGFKIYLNTEDDVMTPEILTYGFHEEYETELIKKIIKPARVVLDIGANVGYYSLMAAQLVGEKGKVYAFEPAPLNYQLLLANIKENGFTNIVPIQRVLSNKGGKTQLFLDKGNWGAHTLCDRNIQIAGHGVLEIEAITLDDFFKAEKENKVDFIKMDVQGAEGLVLEGSLETLRHHEPAILMEFWPKGLRNLQSDPCHLLQSLHQLNYSIKVISDEAIQEIEDLERVVVVAEDREYVNLLLEKKRF